MKSSFQKILISCVLLYVGLTNFFQAIFSFSVVQIGFWAYQVQIFLSLYLTGALMGNICWLTYEYLDTIFSWRRYNLDKGWDFIKNDYESFRRKIKYEQNKVKLRNMETR